MAKSSIYLRFLNLSHAASSNLVGVDLLALRLLESIGVAHSNDKALTVTDAMSLRAIASPATMHRKLNDLLEAGLIEQAYEGTAEDEFSADKQIDNFQKIADSCQGIGISFSWEFDKTGTKHDRDITTDTGWKIVLSRGLDIFQRYELNEAFSFSNRLQQHRQCKEFNLTYVKVKK